ncbi:MAG: dethiobiotin synthetase [Frankiales bacterium]|jgi:dethiobiotin synthetase|nr:dethiobiotin synthetase [Frankiales bacterium]
MSVLVVTGTGTGIGKTVVTAGLAALARSRGSSVAVVKPAQTGVVPGQLGDGDTVAELAGLTPSDVHEFSRYPDPLSPAAAARMSGLDPVSVPDAARRIADLAERHRLVLVEGAGGLLVRYDEDGATIADLAHELNAPLLVVTAAGLGTLNATALTLEAMAHRGLELSGIVIGSWPADPDLAARSNVRDLETLGARPLAGAMPAGAGALDPGSFLAAAQAALAPAYGGSFDAADFRDRHQPTRKGHS